MCKRYVTLTPGLQAPKVLFVPGLHPHIGIQCFKTKCIYTFEVHPFILFLYQSNITAHVSYSERLRNSVHLIPPKAQKLQASYHACRLTDNTLDTQVQRSASKETNLGGYWPPAGLANLVPLQAAAPNSHLCIITWPIYLTLHAQQCSPRELPAVGCQPLMTHFCRKPEEVTSVRQGRE